MKLKLLISFVAGCVMLLFAENGLNFRLQKSLIITIPITINYIT